MKKAVFAVCDPEKEYAHNFMEYLNQKQSHPYEIQAFSSVETLMEYGRKHEIEILLANPNGHKLLYQNGASIVKRFFLKK